jgi:hypothetical protein
LYQLGFDAHRLIRSREGILKDQSAAEFVGRSRSRGKRESRKNGWT